MYFREKLANQVGREVVREDRKLIHVGRVHDDLHFAFDLEREFRENLIEFRMIHEILLAVMVLQVVAHSDLKFFGDVRRIHELIQNGKLASMVLRFSAEVLHDRPNCKYTYADHIHAEEQSR